jgi:hypothetical protein
MQVGSFLDAVDAQPAARAAVLHPDAATEAVRQQLQNMLSACAAASGTSESRASQAGVRSQPPSSLTLPWSPSASWRNQQAASTGRSALLELDTLEDLLTLEDLPEEDLP